MQLEANLGTIPEWTLGDRLRKARESAGLNQGELADDVGISRRSVSAYESGESRPSRPVLFSWALRCGVPLPWLQTGLADAETLSVAKRPHYATEDHARFQNQESEIRVDGRTEVDAELLQLAKRIPMRARAAVAS